MTCRTQESSHPLAKKPSMHSSQLRSDRGVGGATSNVPGWQLVTLRHLSTPDESVSLKVPRLQTSVLEDVELVVLLELDVVVEVVVLVSVEVLVLVLVLVLLLVVLVVIEDVELVVVVARAVDSALWVELLFGPKEVTGTVLWSQSSSSLSSSQSGKSSHRHDPWTQAPSPHVN